MTMHVNMYDTVPWCEADDPWKDGDQVGGGAPTAPEDGTCYACLDAIIAYGARAMHRKLELVQLGLEQKKERGR